MAKQKGKGYKQALNMSSSTKKSARMGKNFFDFLNQEVPSNLLRQLYDVAAPDSVKRVMDVARPVYQGASAIMNSPSGTPFSPPPASPAMSPSPQSQAPSPAWDEFVRRASVVAQQQGFPLEVLLGQAALETGRNPYNAPGNNWFGIKGAGSAGSSNLATQEQGAQGLYNTRGNFAAYNSPEESVNAYINLIKTKYPKAWEQRANKYNMLNAIKAGGYATDNNYVAKVTGTPEFRGAALPQKQQGQILGASVAPRALKPSSSLKSYYNTLNMVQNAMPQVGNKAPAPAQKKPSASNQPIAKTVQSSVKNIQSAVTNLFRKK